MFNSIIPLLGAILLLAVAALILVRPLRRAVISRPLFASYRKVLPQMSGTERDALEAGQQLQLLTGLEFNAVQISK